MKRFTLVLTICISSFSLFAQDTVAHKQHNQDTIAHRQYNNEFGFDATPFIKQFLNFSQTQFPQYYTPTYYLTYRRYFAKGNLRIAIGADIRDNQSLPYYGQDSTILHDKRFTLNARVGWEWLEKLGKKWQVFYGVDFLADYIYEKSDANNATANMGGYIYSMGTLSSTQIFGLGPVLGVRFNLTKRLSIMTETSYSINWEQDASKTYYTSLSGNQAPPIADQSVPTIKKLYSTFTQPVSLFITFRI